MTPHFIFKKNSYSLRLVVIALFVFSFIAPYSAKAAGNWALDFDGTSNYATIPTINIGTVFTFECWFYQDSLERWRTLLKDDWSGNNFGSIYSDSTGLQTDLSWWLNSERLFLIHNLNIQTWYHLALVADGTTVNLYINGQTAEPGVAASPNYNNDLEIGKADNGESWDGRVDDLRIYSRALSAGEVLEHYQKTFNDYTNLKGLWHFNEGSGTAIADSSGHGRDGTVSGAGWAEGVNINDVAPEPEEEETVTSSIDTSETGISNDSPTVDLETHFAGAYRGEVSINYSASDPNSDLGALKASPITIFYSNDRGYIWHKLAEDLPSPGTYIFDTAKVPDGTDYVIRVVASDGYDYTGVKESEIFAIDNTAPIFDVQILSSLPIQEKDTIELKIISSESLKTLPVIKITQEGSETREVVVRGSGKEFFISYYILRGYSGKAVINISGSDLIGNVGTIISSGKTFSVGRYGPPPSVIQTPTDGQTFSNPKISVIGTSQPNTDIILTLNGITVFSAQSSDTGSFRIDNVILNSADKGRNTLSIIAVNKNKEEGEEVVLKVKLNTLPLITITSISLDEVITGEKNIEWVANDPNGDDLSFSIEYSNDGGSGWGFVAKDLHQNSYALDTTQFADGSNYFLKITADDGFEKNSANSKRFAVKNNLPYVFLDIPFNYASNKRTPAFSGRVTGSEQRIDSVWFSLDEGTTWQKAIPSDGRFDSLIEEIEIIITPPLTDGKYTLWVRATDVLNRSVKVPKTFYIDTQAPPATVLSSPDLNRAVDDALDSNQELEGVQVIFQGRTEKEAKIELVLEDQLYKTEADQKGDFIIKDVTLWRHGLNSVFITSVDLAGNVAKFEGSVVSNNAPEITVLKPQGKKFLGGAGEIIFEAKDSENDSVTAEILYQKKNQAWRTLVKDLPVWEDLSTVYKWQISGVSNGEYSIKIIVSDQMSQAEKITDVFIDNIPPIVFFGVSKTPVILTGASQQIFSGRVSDDFSGIEGVEYSFDDINWYKALITKGYQTQEAGFSFHHQFFLDDGHYQLKARAADLAGNIAYSDAQEVIVDNTPPIIGSNLISSGMLPLFPDAAGEVELLKENVYNILVSISGDAKEASLQSGEANFKLDFNQSTLLWQTEFSFNYSGRRSLEITAKDEVGNVKTKKIASLNVLSPGKIYDAKSGQPVGGVNLTLYVSDQNNNWAVWDGRSFGQNNPQKTEESGEYGFLVPPGRYRLEASSFAFGGFKSESLEVKQNSLINPDIALTAQGFFNRILNYITDILGS